MSRKWGYYCLKSTNMVCRMGCFVLDEKVEGAMGEEIKEICPICNGKFAVLTRTNLQEDPGVPAYHVKCARCGKFCLRHSLQSKLEFFRERQQVTEAEFSKVSSKINEAGELIILDLTMFQNWKASRMPSFHEKADKLLLELEKRTSYAGQNVDVKDPALISVSWAINSIELQELIYYLDYTKRIDGLRSENAVYISKGFPVAINFDGWAHLEKLKSINTGSKQGFVAMWFSDLVSGAEKAIRSAIESAGFSPMLIKDKEHTGKICDEIVAEIRRSRFLVADFTGHRGGVYFEAGFAMGLGLPVIWTCREDAMKDLHFDIRQYNCIDWRSEEDLNTRLTNRIRAILIP